MRRCGTSGGTDRGHARGECRRNMIRGRPRSGSVGVPRLVTLRPWNNTRSPGRRRIRSGRNSPWSPGRGGGCGRWVSPSTRTRRPTAWTTGSRRAPASARRACGWWRGAPAGAGRSTLARPPEGPWTVEGRATGRDGGAPPGGDAAALAGAVDCDLGLSPLTNTLPVLRLGLLAARPPVGAARTTSWWRGCPCPTSACTPPRSATDPKGADARGQPVVRYEDAEGASPPTSRSTRTATSSTTPSWPAELGGGER